MIQKMLQAILWWETLGANQNLRIPIWQNKFDVETYDDCTMTQARYDKESLEII